MRDKILIVDDAELNREMLSVILGEAYETIGLEDGQLAIDYLEKNQEEVVIILLDLLMPNVDGYQVLEYMKMANLLDTIPVLVISSESSPDVERKCLKLGVSDFIRKPFDNIAVTRRVNNFVDLFTYKNDLEQKVAYQTETLKKQNRLLMEQAETLKKNNEKIIDMLGSIVEYRNVESDEHIKRVKAFTQILANEVKNSYPEYGLNDEKVNVIITASALHDIGKIAISDSILLKPGKLTKDEEDHLRSHTTRGCDILNEIENAWDDEYEEICHQICRHHHERYDGNGYPDGLSGENIPISAQIVSLADEYDTLVSERLYKEAIDPKEAFNMIVTGDCGVFSPKIIECFRKSKDAFEKIISE